MVKYEKIFESKERINFDQRREGGGNFGGRYFHAEHLIQVLSWIGSSMVRRPWVHLWLRHRRI